MEVICLRSAYIALGYACNHNCIFCPCGKDRPRNTALSIDEFKQSIESVIKSGATSVTISGGEPTLQPLLFDYLKILEESQLHIELLSNSDSLSDVKLVTQIVSAISPNKLSLTTSIHSHQPEIHDYVTSCQGSWKRTIQGLKNAHSNGIRVTVKHCIAKQNYKDISAFVSFIYDTFPDDVGLLFCSIDYCGLSSENAVNVQVTFREEGKYIEQALDKVIFYRDIEKRLRLVVVTDTPLCCIDPYYWEFYSCISKYEISAYAAPSSNGTGHLTSLNVPSDCGTYFTACRQCDAEPICSGAWRTAYELFGENAVESIKFKNEEN